MNLSKTTSYLLSILSYMAKNTEEICSANYLHTKLHIPLQYLRQLLTKLSKNGFIQSTHGRNGGFILSKSVNEIYVADIIDLVEGLESYNKCMLGFTECPLTNQCSVHDFWEITRSSIINKLKTTSLADLLAKK